MKKCFLGMMLILFALGNFWAQDERDSYNAPSYGCYIYSYGKYQKNTTAYIFGDKVNLRKEPKIADNIVSTLLISHPVQILEMSDVKATINGYEENWYRVRTLDDNAKMVEGFVWGGVLAKVALLCDIDGDKKNEIFLAGIVSYSPKDFEKQAEARLVKDKRVLSVCPFKPTEMNEGASYYYSMMGNVLPDKGFSPKAQIFQLFYEYGACDYPQGETFFFWNGKSLINGLTTIYSFNEIGYIKNIYIFPNDQGGKANVFTIQRITHINDEDRVETSTNLVRYLWKGDKLELQK